MRHCLVSLLSDEGVPIEHIAGLVGHAGGPAVTETIYRKQLRPVIDEGATVMDRVFSIRGGSQSVGHSPHPGTRGQRGVADHRRRGRDLDLWVADKGALAEGSGEYPLLDGGTVDIFRRGCRSGGTCAASRSRRRCSNATLSPAACPGRARAQPRGC